MKNLLVYISPQRELLPEYAKMLEIQIDNSLLYWEPNDIILLTNFPYEYNGIKAIVGPDSLANKSYITNERGIINSKINAIIYLLENKIINELTWFHDLDCFQLAPLDLPPIAGDIGITHYGIYPESRFTFLGKKFDVRVNFGSVFFKPESLDIFKLLLERMAKDNLYEEDAMTLMYDQNFQNIRSRIQVMNKTYNIGMRCLRSNLQIASRPIRVAHFPAYDPGWLNKLRAILPARLAWLIDEKFKKT